MSGTDDDADEIAAASTRDEAPAVARIRRAARNVRATAALAYEAAPRLMVAVVAITVVGAVLAPGALYFTSRFIDAVALRPVSPFEPTILLPVLALGLLSFVNRAFTVLLERNNDVFSDRVWMLAHKRFVAHVATLDLALFDDPTWQNKLQRARADVGWRPYNLAVTLVHILSSSITLLTLFSALAVLDPTLLLLAVGSVIPPTLARVGVNQRLYDFFWKSTRREREHDYLINLATQPQYAKEVRAYGLERVVVERAKALSQSRLVDKQRLYVRATLHDLIGAAGASLLLLAAYFVLAKNASLGTMSIGSIAAVFGAFTSVAGHLGATLQAFVTVDQHAKFMDDYFDVMGVKSALHTLAPEQEPATPLSGVALRGVGFSYPGHGTPSLREVSLEVKPGEVIALVGDNGAGKSTIVKLLLRFFDPTDGAVSFGGVDARHVPPELLRKRVGVLFQDFANYELELRAGLHFGRIDVPFDDAAGLQALQRAQASALTEELLAAARKKTQEANDGQAAREPPQTVLDVVVGRLLDGGHDLSGGQWQRLALARLIYRDADLWILDEPTANLDPAAEAAVFEALREALSGKMAIIISHRFSTVRSADRIYVLEAGRVREQGSHAELMAQNGRYAELFGLQAAGYR